MLMADEKDVKTEIGVEELRDQLDALWEKHLILLDSYHRAQQQIASHFSRGFFDLAQATFKSTTRVRYGQEYYDDRMQATTRFEASVDRQDTPHLALKVNDTPSPSTKPSNKDATEKSPVSSEESDKKDQEDKSEEQGQNDEPDKSKQEDKPEDKEKALNKVRDPLHWYGILVPPSLRSSQKSFNSAIHSPVMDAANSAQALHRVDMDIRKLRKDIKKAEKKRVV
jgi:hypothetical protein